MEHIPVVKHLLSVLRNKETGPAEFRTVSDRIMRLLIEEAIATELDKPTRKQSPTGDFFDHFALKHASTDYCAVTIIRSGDAMI